jgi:hypothetical protein
MRMRCSALVLVAVIGGPASAVGAPAANSPRAQSVTSAPASHVATHSVQGVVRWIAPESLVIRRSVKKASDLSFRLNPATLRAGPIDIGSTVAVRYYIEGKTSVATAVTVRKVKR